MRWRCSVVCGAGSSGDSSKQTRVALNYFGNKKKSVWKDFGRNHFLSVTYA